MSGLGSFCGPISHVSWFQDFFTSSFLGHGGFCWVRCWEAPCQMMTPSLTIFVVRSLFSCWSFFWFDLQDVPAEKGEEENGITRQAYQLALNVDFITYIQLVVTPILNQRSVFRERCGSVLFIWSYGRLSAVWPSLTKFTSSGITLLRERFSKRNGRKRWVSVEFDALQTSEQFDSTPIDSIHSFYDITRKFRA